MMGHECIVFQAEEWEARRCADGQWCFGFAEWLGDDE